MGICAGLAVASEHQVAEADQGAGFARSEEAFGDGDRELGEDAAELVRGNQGVL
jgi:hypothetical protein